MLKKEYISYIESLARIFRDKTKLKIIMLLNEKEYTLTELWKKLTLKNRASVFKSLEFLRANKIVKRRFDSKIRGHYYGLDSEGIKVSHTLGIDKGEN